jgi:hypothetical protein
MNTPDAQQHVKQLEEENELLLFQLHQVQEELEHYFLLYQANEKKLAGGHGAAPISAGPTTISPVVVLKTNPLAKLTDWLGWTIHRRIVAVKQSGAFDEAWYLEKYPDVAQAGKDPVEHYLRHGAAEGRNPSPYFDGQWYVREYPDVAQAGVNPLLHYLSFGRAESRRPSGNQPGGADISLVGQALADLTKRLSDKSAHANRLDRELEQNRREKAALAGQQEEAAKLAEALQEEGATLSRARDEQAALAAQRQGELLQLTRAHVTLEKEKSNLQIRQQELEKKLEKLAGARDEQTRLVALKIQDLSATLAQRTRAVDVHFKRQSDDLIQVRRYLAAAFEKKILHSTKQIQALIGLQGYYATGELPTMNNERHTWPINPDFALYLVELIEFNDYDLIIEFGSGVSTVVVAKALAKAASRRLRKRATEFFSFEHLYPYYQQTRSHLQQAGLEDAVQLTLAPLQDWQAPNGSTHPYYGCQPALATLAKKHVAVGLRLLVIVDGPPIDTAKHARYPAMPLLLEHFSGMHIDFLIDDFIRGDEKEIVRLWQADLEAAGLVHTVSERELEKGCCLISVQADNH